MGMQVRMVILMQSKTVLIVDDQAGIRVLLGEVVAELGCRVLLAKTGAEALQQLAERPDIILLDMNMPGLSGIETLAEVQKQVPGLPVLMITAAEDQGKLAEAKALGAVGCIHKPFDILNFRSTVEQILK